MPLGDLREILHRLSVLYLGAPVFIFLLGWLRPIYAGPLALLLGLAIFRHFRERSIARRTLTKSTDVLVRWPVAGAVLLITGMVVCISGAGGYGIQNSDWLKHNAVLRDLIVHPWPVAYQELPGQPQLVYYLAYYLPAAVVGKLLGWHAANHALFLTTLIGTWLAVGWTVVLCPRRPWRAAVVFLLFSGMDFVGKAAGALALGKGFDTLAWEHVEWWAVLWQYSSNVSLLCWVPQHAIAAWLVSAILLSQRDQSIDQLASPLLLVLLLLWSPFAFLGALPFVAVEYYEWAFLKRRAGIYCTVPNFAALPIAAVLALYLAAHFSFPAVKIPMSANSSAPNGWLVWCDAADLGGRLFTLARHAVFCVLEFGWLAGICLFIRPLRERAERRWLVAALVTLSVLPMFRYGHYNDLVMRASIPALYVVLYALLETMPMLHRNRFAGTMLVILLAVGALTPIAEVTRHARAAVAAHRIVAVPEARSVLTLQEIQAQYRFDFLGQYLGSPKAAFFKYLARRETLSDRP